MGDSEFCGVCTRFKVLDGNPFYDLDSPPAESTSHSGPMVQLTLVNPYNGEESDVKTPSSHSYLGCSLCVRLTAGVVTSIAIQPHVPTPPALHPAQVAVVDQLLDAPTLLPQLISSLVPDLPGNYLTKTFLILGALSPADGDNRLVTVVIAPTGTPTDRVISRLGALPFTSFADITPRSSPSFITTTHNKTIHAGALATRQHVYIHRHANLTPQMMGALTDHLADASSAPVASGGQVSLKSTADLTLTVDDPGSTPWGHLKLPTLLVDSITLPLFWDSTPSAQRDALETRALLSRRSGLGWGSAEGAGRGWGGVGSRPESVLDEVAMATNYVTRPVAPELVDAILIRLHGRGAPNIKDNSTDILDRFAKSVVTQLETMSSPDLHLCTNLHLGLTSAARGLAVLRGSDVTTSVCVAIIELYKAMLTVRLGSGGGGLSGLSRAAGKKKTKSRIKLARALEAALGTVAEGRGSSMFIKEDIVNIGRSQCDMTAIEVDQAIEALNGQGALIMSKGGYKLCK